MLMNGKLVWWAVITAKPGHELRNKTSEKPKGYVKWSEMKISWKKVDLKSNVI